MSSWKIVPALFALSVEKHDERVMKREWVVGDRQVSEEDEVCPCGKTGIRELCWVVNRQTGQRIFMGNCCVRFFDAIGKCMRCKIYPAVSPTAHYCEFCAHNRKDKPTGRVTKGTPRRGPPIVGLTYQEALDANPQYAKYIHDTPSQAKWNDPHFLQFIRVWIAQGGRGVSGVENG